MALPVPWPGRAWRRRLWARRGASPCGAQNAACPTEHCRPHGCHPPLPGTLGPHWRGVAVKAGGQKWRGAPASAGWGSDALHALRGTGLAPGAGNGAGPGLPSSLLLSERPLLVSAGVHLRTRCLSAACPSTCPSPACTSCVMVAVPLVPTCVDHRHPCPASHQPSTSGSISYCQLAGGGHGHCWTFPAHRGESASAREARLSLGHPRLPSAHTP